MSVITNQWVWVLAIGGALLRHGDAAYHWVGEDGYVACNPALNRRAWDSSRRVARTTLPVCQECARLSPLAPQRRRADARQLAMSLEA